MKYVLRKAVAEDAVAINGLFVEMLRSIYGKEDVEGYREGALDYYFCGGEDWICVAENERGIAAFLAIEVHREENGFLYYDDFCVKKEYRGRGIGSALLDEAETYCRSLGFSTVLLHVEQSNLAARRLYEKRGFTILRQEGTRLCLISRVD